MVAQVPINDLDDNHNSSSDLSASRRSGGQSALTYDLRKALQDYLRLKGTTEEEIQTHLKALGDHPFKRYNRSWIKFLQMAYTKRSFSSIRDLDTTPTTSLAYWLIQFAEKESVAEARCAYAALLLFSGTNALPFKSILKGLKKKWNYTVPRYVVYYDVPRLLQQLPYQEAQTDSQVRLRLILVFRFFALFRGIDLERTKRTDIIKHDKVWFVMSRRKGRPVHEPCPIHAMFNVAFCPIYWLSVALDMTIFYEGPALFVSLKPPRRPILASTINSLTTTFLRSMGLHEFTAHSTRGSAATALISLEVDPHVVCELGDWRSYDTFRRFYDRVRAMSNVAQSLVPEASVDSEWTDGVDRIRGQLSPILVRWGVGGASMGDHQFLSSIAGTRSRMCPETALRCAALHCTATLVRCVWVKTPKSPHWYCIASMNMQGHTSFA